MPDVTGGDENLDLSIAYRALKQRRDDFLAQRERITAELDKLDAALEALRALSGIEQGPAAVNGRHQAAPAKRKRPGKGEEPEPRPAEQPAKETDRKTRVIELLLDNPQQWFSSTEVAGVTEPGKATAAQRNAVSETLRRLLRHGAVERDASVKPVKYRAVPSALREVLLAHE